jgi:hypothetical protein
LKFSFNNCGIHIHSFITFPTSSTGLSKIGGKQTESFRLTLVMGDTIEKVSKSSILTKVSILSILAKSIGNSIPLEPAMFLVSIPDQSLNTS